MALQQGGGNGATFDYSFGQRPKVPTPPPGHKNIIVSDGGNLRRTTIDTGGVKTNIFGVPDKLGGGGGGSSSSPRPTGTTSGGSSRSGGGGGGYGGPPPIDAAAIMAALNQFRPDMYEWTDIKLPEYEGQGFYDFNRKPYDMMRGNIDTGINQARTSGMNAIGEAREQIQNNPLAYQGGNTTMDPGMSAAMQRMFAANDTPLSVNQRTMDEGVQADAAFGNLMSILGANEQQRRASDMRALQGDERRLGESLDMQRTQLGAQVDMQLALAEQQYEIDKWTYGEEIAQQNHAIRTQQILANSQGRQQTENANVDIRNTTNQGALDAIVDLLSSGVKVDPNAYKQV